MGLPRTGADGRAGRQVVVTGLGLISSLGATTREFWAGLLAASRQPDVYEDPIGTTRRLYRVGSLHDGAGGASALAARAAKAAVADADLTADQVSRAGVVVATSLGDVDLLERAYNAATASDTDSPYCVASAVAQALSSYGPNHSLSTGCAAGAHAIGLAAAAISGGAAEVVVTGGAEKLSWVAVAALERLQVLDPQLCRPLDAHRRGMVPGEGAAFLVLESLEHAVARGHPDRYAVVEGFATTSDAYHLTAPDPSGRHIGDTVKAALAAAAVSPASIGAVVPHRAGIRHTDTVEAQAIAAVLPRPALVPAYASKAVLGHTAGAAGAFACAAGALMLKHRLVPPNAHVCTPDPAFPFRLVTGAPAPLDYSHILVTGTGFGGSNVAIVLGKELP